MIRFVALFFLIIMLVVVGKASAQCRFCPDGKMPANQDATVSSLGGITCRYIFNDASSLSSTSPQCLLIQKPQIRQLCGCSLLTAPAVTVTPPTPPPAPVVSRQEGPTTTTAVVVGVGVTSNTCSVCVGGTKPRNMGAILNELGGISCGYVYFNGDFARPTSQQCMIAQKPSSQVICGCPLAAPTLAPVDRGEGPSGPAIQIVTTRAPIRNPPPPTKPPTVRRPVAAPIMKPPPTRSPTVRRPVAPPTKPPTVRRPVAAPPTRSPTVRRPVAAPINNNGAAACQLCLNNGGTKPLNMQASIDVIGGLTCGYVYYNAFPTTSQQCQAVHTPKVQTLCGCSGTVRMVVSNAEQQQQQSSIQATSSTTMGVVMMSRMVVAVMVGAMVVMM